MHVYCIQILLMLRAMAANIEYAIAQLLALLINLLTHCCENYSIIKCIYWTGYWFISLGVRHATWSQVHIVARLHGCMARMYIFKVRPDEN